MYGKLSTCTPKNNRMIKLHALFFSLKELKHNFIRYIAPRGGTRSLRDGGSDRASYCKPKKINKPKILDPKKNLTSKFPTQKNTHVAEKKFD